MATTVRVRGGEVVVTDGPFAETKEQLGGYYLIECADLDAAIEIAAGIPGRQGRFDRDSPDQVALLARSADRRLRKTESSGRRGCGGRAGVPGAVGARARRPHSHLGDFDLAEEAFQDAMVVALEHWPVHGAPDEPGGVDHDDGSAPGDRPVAARSTS